MSFLFANIYGRIIIMLEIKPKMIISSQNVIGTKIANELSETGIHAVTRTDFSEETLRKHNAVLIDNTKGDMEESFEALILSEKTTARVFVLTNDFQPLIADKNGVLFISEKLGNENIREIISYALSVRNSRKQMERAISQILLYIGFQTNFKGYRYIMEAVIKIVEDAEYNFEFKWKVYPFIAELYGVSAFSVERAIRNSIESAYDRNYQKFKDFFGYPLPKPTNTEFISLCAEKVRVALF